MIAKNRDFIQLGEVYMLKNVVMTILSYNIHCIGGYCTISETICHTSKLLVYPD